MRKRKLLVALAVAFFAAAHLVHAQDDAPSLGDVARQTRQQKLQKDAQPKPADSKDATITPSQTRDVATAPTGGQTAQPPKVKRVITNDEIPSRYAPAGYRPGNQPPQNWGQNPTYNQPAYTAGKFPAETWTAQIQAQKSMIANLQSEIERVNSSIQYAGGNCVTNCVQWNEQQKRKQDQVESMKAQLEGQQKRLEELQEAARQQGYGSSVYDP